MLIVEGTDGVGKTTLCRRLLDRLPTHVYAHFTRLPAGFDYYWGYADRAGADVVQDRFHLSEVAYAAACGRPCGLTPDLYALVDARLRALGAFTVVVLADPELVRSRWDESQMYDLGTTLRAGEAFADVAGRPDFYRADVDLVITCDVGKPYATDDDVDEVLEGYRRRRGLVAAVAARRPPGL